MPETTERSAVQNAPEKSNSNAVEKSSADKVRDEVRQLYEQTRNAIGGSGSRGGANGSQEHMALGADTKTLAHIPDGGVAKDGSLVFGIKDTEIGKPPKPSDNTRYKGPLDSRSSEQQPGVKRDAQGRVTEVDYPNGQARKFGYDQSGNLNSITQPDGTVLTKEGDEWKVKPGAPVGGGVRGGAEGGHAGNDAQKKEEGKEKNDKREIGSLLEALGGAIANGGKRGAGVADIVDPKVAADGTFTYGTKDGSQHTIKVDGGHEFKKTDGATVKQDADGRTTSVEYGNGQSRSFEYNNGQVSKVTDTDGKVYQFRDGHWVGADGKPSEKTNFSVGNDGAVTYQDRDGSRVTQRTDRTSEIVNANNSTMVRDADGRITEERLNNGKTRSFEYDKDGQPTKITEPDGSVVTRDGSGNWSDGRKDVRIDNDGTVQYVNKDNHVVIDGTDGNRRTSSKTADELNESAEKLHGLIDHSYPLINNLTGPMINRELEKMSPTDRALVAQEYEKKYGHKLTDDINGSLREGDAAKANKMIYTAQLQEYAARNIPDAPGNDGKNQRQAFLDNMNEFINRAERDKVSDKEVADTLGQVLRIGNASDAKVTGQERLYLTQQIMHHAAHPDQIDQGGHNTCNVTDVEMLTYTRNPSQAARMVADVALTGEYTANDGKKILIPPQNLVPDAEARVNPPDDGRRGFASQIFQATTLNDAAQRWNPPKYCTNIAPGGGADTGEFWTDAHGNPLLREKKDDKGNVVKDANGNPVMEKDRFAGLGYHEISDEVKRLTGESKSVLVSWEDGKLRSFESEDDLRKIITDAQKDGKMPLIIDVTADDKLFGGDKPVGDNERHAGNHVVVIRDYNPTTGMVRVDNSWGSSSDKWVPLTDLYNASK